VKPQRTLIASAIAASPHDMIDVMTRLDGALKAGRLIGSFGLSAAAP
jgi:hypothetical protein